MSRSRTPRRVQEISRGERCRFRQIRCTLSCARWNARRREGRGEISARGHRVPRLRGGARLSRIPKNTKPPPSSATLPRSSTSLLPKVTTGRSPADGETRAWLTCASSSPAPRAEWAACWCARSMRGGGRLSPARSSARTRRGSAHDAWRAGGVSRERRLDRRRSVAAVAGRRRDRRFLLARRHRRARRARRAGAHRPCDRHDRAYRGGSRQDRRRRAPRGDRALGQHEPRRQPARGA